MEATIEKHGEQYRVVTRGAVYEVSSINKFGASKLDAMVENGNTVDLSLEPITEYYSDEYRAGISQGGGWDLSRDVACLLRDYIDPDLVEAEAMRLEQEAMETLFIPFPEV